jgi:hypothetical protein
MKRKFYDIVPGDGSHYLCENGRPIARFNDLAKAEAVRANLINELAAMHERNAETLTNDYQFTANLGASIRTLGSGGAVANPDSH